MATIRLNLYLSRKSAWLLAATGVLELISGPAVWPDAAGLFYAMGAVFIIETPLLVVLRVYKYRQLVRQDVEFTITDEGIQRRTENHSLRVAWEMVERASELKDYWIFITKKPIRRIVLRKRGLSQEQQAELAAFIEVRNLNTQVRGGMTPVQEAGYALAYGVARSDLNPEVQAEYDRLVAERGPA
jgi:hypothetical protein